MICHKCKNDGVENEALGKKFWYCRTCKDEISAAPPEEKPKKTDDSPYWYIGQGAPAPWKMPLVPGDTARVVNPTLRAIHGREGKVVSVSGILVEVELEHFGSVCLQQDDLIWVSTQSATFSNLLNNYGQQPATQPTDKWVQLDLFYDSLDKKGKSYD